MTDTQLKFFLYAAKFENFTKAAEALYTSQPVLGRNISSLEKELGYQLFERNRKRVRLTENGKIFQEFLEDTFKRYRTIASRIDQNLREIRMKLSLGLIVNFDIGSFISPAIKYITDIKPNYGISIHYFQNTDKMLEALNNGFVDAIICEDSDVKKHAEIFQSKFFRETKGVLIASRSLCGTEDRPLEIPDSRLSGMKCIIRSSQDSDYSRQLQIASAKAQGIKDFVEVPNQETLSAFVKAGIGVAFVTDNLELCTDPQLRCVPVKDGNIYIEEFAWLKDNNNPAINVFCEALDRTEECRKADQNG